MAYKLEEVTSKKQRKEFLALPKRLYKDNPYWVCPLDSDIEGIFDPAKNKKFEDGEAVRWLVRDPKGMVVGRIAAFYNREQAAVEEQPTGCCGFFESVDDQKVAGLLFDASRDWLVSKGMEAMDGPVNFGSRESWWGLLVDGFDIQPLYANPYNPPYYQALFENYGFRNYFNQYTYNRKMKSGIFSPSVYERVKRLYDTPGYRFEHIGGRKLSEVAESFRTIYNKAWSHHAGVKPMEKEDAQKFVTQLKPIIDPQLIYFAYFNDEPIGFFIMVPDINRIIGRFNGRLNLINKLRFLWLLKRKKADRIFAIIFGVTPEFHGKGVESGIIHEFEQNVERGMHYKSLELAWVGDFNPIMMRMVENYVCATKLKTHVTYRYLFDRAKEFKRAPRIGGKK